MAFTAIYEKVPENAKMVGSVNAGNPKKLKVGPRRCWLPVGCLLAACWLLQVGGGTINGQFAQELKASGQDPDAYSPMHEALLRTCTKSGAR